MTNCQTLTCKHFPLYYTSLECDVCGLASGLLQPERTMSLDEASKTGHARAERQSAHLKVLLSANVSSRTFASALVNLFEP